MNHGDAALMASLFMSWGVQDLLGIAIFRVYVPHEILIYVCPKKKTKQKLL